MNFIENFSLEGYKSFGKKVDFKFSIPNGQIGSGLNIVIGPNGSGKSSVFEILNSISNIADITRDDNLSEEDRLLEIKNTEKQIYGNLNINPKSKNISIKYNAIDIIFEFGHRGEIKKSYSTYNKSGSEFQDYQIFATNICSNMFAPIRCIGSKIIEKQWKHYTEGYKNKNIKHKPDNFVEVNGIEHYFEALSDGQKRDDLLKYYSKHFSNLGQKILIIDEPESHLHPQLIITFSKNIAEISKTNQIILFTHSAHFINYDWIKNGGKVHSIYKDKEHDSNVGILYYEDTDIVSDNYYNLNNLEGTISQNKSMAKSYIFDIKAKESLFCEKVLLVEGIEDVCLINKLGSRLV